MNHQIEDHMNIGPALYKGSHPVALDETGLDQTFLELSDTGIESLDVADLEHSSALLGQRKKLICFFKGRRHRLLQKEIDPVFKERLGDFEMRRRWNNHTRRIDLSEEGRHIGKRFTAAIGGN